MPTYQQGAERLALYDVLKVMKQKRLMLSVFPLSKIREAAKALVKHRPNYLKEAKQQIDAYRRTA